MCVCVCVYGIAQGAAGLLACLLTYLLALLDCLLACLLDYRTVGLLDCLLAELSDCQLGDAPSLPCALNLSPSSHHYGYLQYAAGLAWTLRIPQ